MSPVSGRIRGPDLSSAKKGAVLITDVCPWEVRERIYRTLAAVRTRALM
jgi:hypothetical protein